jgi:hypothetical protein
MAIVLAFGLPMAERAAGRLPSAHAQASLPSDADAHWWDGFAGDSGLENRSEAMITHQNSIVVGGWFTQAGGVVTGAVARWSGGTWSPVGLGLSNTVYAFTPYGNSLAAGGDFAASGPNPRARIAAWNGTEWTPLGSGLNSSVYALSVLGGSLVAGGAFTQADEAAAPYVAYWDNVGWNTFGSGGMNMPVYALTTHDGCVVAGGAFTQAGGVPCSYVAKLCDGATWEPLGSGMNGGVRVLGEYNGDLIAGGSFTTAGGVTANRIARWDGTAWSALGSGADVGTNGTVSALTVFDGHLIVGGFFSAAGGRAASNIAAWDGRDWRAMGSGTDGAVTCFASESESLFVGGGFIHAGRKESFHIAKWVGSVTAVTLASFFAERSDRGVMIRWEVAEERDHAGFHVFRGEPGGERRRLTPRILSGQDEYQFLDPQAPWTSVSYWLQEVSRSGEATWLGPVIAPPGGGSPAGLAVSDARPNPFGARTTCTYTLPEAGWTWVTVHDAQGRRVRTLSDGEENAGPHEAAWDGRDEGGAPAASGVYFIRVSWNGVTRATRLILSR